MKIQKSFEIDAIPFEALQNPTDSNADIIVTLTGGNRFLATFFTKKNIDTHLNNHALSGERAYGLYFWSKNLIIVDRLSEDVIRRTIEDLLETGEFEDFLEAIPPH